MTSLGRRLVLTMPLLAAGASVARAATGRAALPDVAVFCDRTLAPALRRAAALFPGPVHIFSAPPYAMLAQIERETQTDVLITTRAAVDEGAARRLVKPETRRAFAVDRLVIAGLRNAGSEARADAAAIRRLLGEGRFAAPDPTDAATVDTAAVVARLGIEALLQGRVAGTLDTVEAAALVGDGPARIGLTYLTDVRADPRLGVAATLTEATAYDAVASYGAMSPNTEIFIAFLQAGEAADRLRAAGLELT